MKKFLFIVVLAGVAIWFHFKTEAPQYDPEAAEDSKAVAEAPPSPLAAGPRSAEAAPSGGSLEDATRKLIASDFSQRFPGQSGAPAGVYQKFTSFESFLKSRPGGTEAMDYLEKRLSGGNDKEKIPDEIFAHLSDALGQVAIDEDTDLRIKILGVLATDPDHAPAVKTLAMREIFTKKTNDDGSVEARMSESAKQRTIAAYQTYLATAPDADEIVSITIDTFYFTEDKGLNEEIKAALGSRFPDLVNKVESRFKEPSSEEHSIPDVDSSAAAPQMGESAQ